MSSPVYYLLKFECGSKPLMFIGSLSCSFFPQIKNLFNWREKESESKKKSGTVSTGLHRCTWNRFGSTFFVSIEDRTKHIFPFPNVLFSARRHGSDVTTLVWICDLCFIGRCVFKTRSHCAPGKCTKNPQEKFLKSLGPFHILFPSWSLLLLTPVTGCISGGQVELLWSHMSSNDLVRGTALIEPLTIENIQAVIDQNLQPLLWLCYVHACAANVLDDKAWAHSGHPIGRRRSECARFTCARLTRVYTPLQKIIAVDRYVYSSVFLLFGSSWTSISATRGTSSGRWLAGLSTFYR